MRNSKEIKKNPQEVEILKLIFSLKDQSKNEQGIANFLNERGYRRRNGSEWTQRQVWSILNHKDLYFRRILKYGEVRGENQDLIIL